MSAGDLPGLIVKVGIVAGLLGGSLWLLRRYAGPGLRQSGRTGVVNIADTVPLAQGRALYVIDIGERALVVGATQQQFSLLAELTDTAVLERLRARPERPAAPWTELSARLSAALGERVRGSDRTRGQAFADVWSASLPEQGQPAGAARDTEATDANARLREMAARIRAARRSA
jgi:flagellar biogenesis protein FliO